MNKKWSYTVAGLVVFASLSGCANYGMGPKAGPHTQNAPYQTPSTYRTNMHHYNAYNYQTGFTAQGFNHDMAERLGRAADDVPGVEGATVAVHNTDAVIGIHTRTNVANTQQRQVIEQQVHAAARSVAPNLNIRVTSDPSMFSRIQTISTSVRGGMTNAKNAVTSGPNTVAGNLSNAASDFTVLIRDLGRTVTAPFR